MRPDAQLVTLQENRCRTRRSRALQSWVLLNVMFAAPTGSEAFAPACWDGPRTATVIGGRVQRPAGVGPSCPRGAGGDPVQTVVGDFAVFRRARVSMQASGGNVGSGVISSASNPLVRYSTLLPDPTEEIRGIAAV
jgi:hypothetical protein